MEKKGGGGGGCKGGMKSVESLQLYIEDDQNKNSIWINKFNHLQPSPYPSRKLSRNLPRYAETTNHLDDHGRLAKLCRKMSGIPLALLYGFIFTIVLKYMILNKLPGQFHIASPPTRYKSNFSCEYGFNSTTNITRALTRQVTQQRNGDDASLQPTSSPKENSNVAYITSAFTLTLGITSIFSCGTRCAMLLVLPGLVTKRSRTFVFTFVMGLLADGPINSLSYNLHQVVENTACIYEAITRISCRNSRQLSKLFVYVQGMEKKVVNIIRGFHSNVDDIVDIQMNVPELHWPDFSNLVKAPKLSEIKQQIDVILNGISECQVYVSILRKVLTVLSILLMVLDAIRYLRSYYSDYSFDNMYVGASVRRYWKNNGYSDVIPMRNWEKNQGYHATASKRFTKRDFYQILRSGFPTFLFALFSGILMLADYLLAEMLQFVINKEEVTIFFEGMEHNFGIARVELKEFNITTETCLRTPLYTSIYLNLGICFFLVIAVLSCVFEVYTSSIRMKICNIFYNQRFQERADFLHRSISAGRVHRTLQLKLIVKNEVERRQRLEQFYPWSYVKRLCKSRRKETTICCPSCQWYELVEETKKVSFAVAGRKVTGAICGNCYLDYDDRPT